MQRFGPQTSKQQNSSKNRSILQEKKKRSHSAVQPNAHSPLSYHKQPERNKLVWSPPTKQPFTTATPNTHHQHHGYTIYNKNKLSTEQAAFCANLHRPKSKMTNSRTCPFICIHTTHTHNSYSENWRRFSWKASVISKISFTNKRVARPSGFSYE